jgi:hypothetical protein
MTDSNEAQPTKRTRKTRKEMIVELEARLAKAIAQEAGTFSEENDNNVLKGLKARLRKTKTTLASMQLLRNGSDGKSSIVEKIKGTEKRLASQIESKNRADKFLAELPFDVQQLEALIEAGEAGETVEFPDGLTKLTDDQEKTTEEHEAKALLEQQTPSE